MEAAELLEQVELDSTDESLFALYVMYLIYILQYICIYEHTSFLLPTADCDSCKSLHCLTGSSALGRVAA